MDCPEKQTSDGKATLFIVAKPAFLRHPALRPGSPQIFQSFVILKQIRYELIIQLNVKAQLILASFSMSRIERGQRRLPFVYRIKAVIQRSHLKLAIIKGGVGFVTEIANLFRPQKSIMNSKKLPLCLSALVPAISFL